MEWYCHTHEGESYQDENSFLNICAPNTRTPKIAKAIHQNFNQTLNIKLKYCETSTP